MGAASAVVDGGITRAKFDNTEVSAIVNELEPSVSRHTGKQLRRLRLVFRSYEPEAKKSIEDAAHAGLRLHLGPDQSGDTTIWILGDELRPKFHGFFEPFHTNTEILSAENSALTERLLEALISKVAVSVQIHMV
jgi:hypothetical protein